MISRPVLFLRALRSLVLCRSKSFVPMKLSTPRDVLNFWFTEDYFDQLDATGGVGTVTKEYFDERMPLWFMNASADFSSVQVENRELIDVVKSIQEPESEYFSTRDGYLARIILFDQFSRTAYRGTAQAFEYDNYTQVLLEDILIRKHPFTWDDFSLAERIFIVTACEHMESTQMSELSIQYSTRLLERQENEKTLASLKKVVADVHQYAYEHAEVIKKFGRYPSRNGALGRASTPAELEWLSSSDLPSWAKSQLTSSSTSSPSSSSSSILPPSNDHVDDVEYRDNKFGLNAIVDSFTIPSTNTTIVLAKGSVIDFTGSAIVNAANEGCLGGGGVDGAITDAGGGALAKARKALPILKGKNVRCPTGECVVTISGDLKARDWCLHAVGPNYNIHPEINRADSLLKAAYTNVMKRGQENKISSIAFSLLSAGVFRGGQSLHRVLEIGVDAVVNNAYKDLKYAVFCCFNDKEVETMLKIFESQKSERRSKIAKI